MLNSIILSIVSSIDSFGIGITYGIKNTKISLGANLILFFISFLTACFSVFYRLAHRMGDRADIQKVFRGGE